MGFFFRTRKMAQNPTPHPSLAISDYDVIGFDLDHTLAKYNIPHLFDVSKCTSL